MPLSELPPLSVVPTVPKAVRRFLREAARRVERLCREGHLPAFVPSDFAGAYRVLRALEASGQLVGRWFCEWGSGLGVTACLASMLEFDAWGIEIEGELVESARRLAADFDLPAEFVQGSFIPTGGDNFVEAAGDCAWLTDSAGGGYEEMGIGPEEFDIVFAYPWPDEECLTAALFEHFAQEGAVLMTYHEVGGLRLRRKISSAVCPLASLPRKRGE